MKRLFFSVLAMAMCAFAVVSCNKDDADVETPEAYLTLEQQQDILAQTISQVAQAIDFSNLQPVSDFIGELMAAGYVRVLTTDVLEELSEKEVLNAFVTFYNSFMKGTVKSLDLSSMYVRVDIATRDSIKDDTVLCLYPYITSISENDCIELNVELKGHKLTLKAKSSEGYSKIEGSLNEYSDKGEKKEPRQTEFIIPNELSLSFLFDQKTLVGYTLNSDTDLKFVENEIPSDDKDADYISTYEVNFSKLEWGMTGQISDVVMTIAGKCHDNNASWSFQTLLDKTPLINGTVELDASISDLLADFSESALLAWALNYEKLRSIGISSSFMGGKVSHNFKLMNPMKDSKMVSYAMNLSEAKEITPELSQQIIEALAPFITSDFNFAGYAKPQASLELQYNREMNLTALITEYAQALGNLPIIGSYVYQIARYASSAAAYVDQAGIAPVVRIHAANAADEKVVGIKEYLEKVDLPAAVNVIKEKLIAVIGGLLEAFTK